MGSTFSPSWTTLAKLKTYLREHSIAGEIVAEVTGPTRHGETPWYVAVKLPEDYGGLKAGDVYAVVDILYSPTARDGAGYKPMSEFAGPYFVDGVTKAFLAKLTPLPPAVEGTFDPAEYARTWRAKATAEAERAEKAKAARKALKVGDKILLTNAKPAGPFTITELKKGGGARALLADYYPYKISRAQLERAIPATEGAAS